AVDASIKTQAKTYSDTLTSQTNATNTAFELSLKSIGTTLNELTDRLEKSITNAAGELQSTLQDIMEGRAIDPNMQEVLDALTNRPPRAILKASGVTHGYLDFPALFL